MKDKKLKLWSLISETIDFLSWPSFFGLSSHCIWQQMSFFGPFQKDITVTIPTSKKMNYQMRLLRHHRCHTCYVMCMRKIQYQCNFCPLYKTLILICHAVLQCGAVDYIQLHYTLNGTCDESCEATLFSICTFDVTKWKANSV